MCQKDVIGMANIVDPDKTAPEEQPDLGLHCLPRRICLLSRIITIIFVTLNSDVCDVVFPLLSY